MHGRSIVALALLKWMSGLPLDQRERAIVDAALADNKAAQLLKIYEGVSA